MTEESIFSKIVAGEIPARIVYEDETTMAFLDANPLTPGHTLVIPKEQYERVADLPADVAADVFRTIHRLVPAVADAVDADGTTIGFNDGEVAGQAVPHVHGHVIPRFSGDGGGSLHTILGAQADLSDDELDELADEIGDRV